MVGSSGSGKTTVGKALAAHLGVGFVELDAVMHGPGWTQAPDDVFRRVVADRAAEDAWVIDGNYSVLARDIVWSRATHVVWVDPPLRTVMRQVVWRSFSRSITRAELWNSNRESFRNWLRADHPIWWALRTHRGRRLRIEEALTDPRWNHLRLRVVRLRSSREARVWPASGRFSEEASPAL